MAFSSLVGEMNLSQNALSINQRNILLYYLNHKKKHADRPCYAPKCPSQANRVHDHIKAMERLEERGFIRLQRSSDDYLSWIIVDP